MTAVTFGCLLSFSTPMIEILETLRLCKIPNTIIDLAAMMHRYIFIIEETAHNMRRAQLSRMGDRVSWLQQVRDTGSAACYVIIKSLDRSVKIYNAMLSRGYNENSTGVDFFTTTIPRTDWYFALLTAVLLTALVIVNIII
jgi:cobalt/nickel transport system permease protein